MADPDDRTAQAEEFLRTRWPTAVEGGWLTLCAREGRGVGLNVVGAYEIEPDRLGKLAREAVELSDRADTWVLLNGLGAKPPEGRKGGEVGLRYLVGLHEDLDRGVEDPLAFLDSLGEWRPSLVVDSGGGVHAYWLWEERVDLATEAEDDVDRLHVVRGQHRQLANRFHAWLESIAGAEFDDCTNLDRIMRLPGTRNHKREEWRAVRIARADNGRRFDPRTVNRMLDSAGVIVKRQQTRLSGQAAAEAYARQGTLSDGESHALLERLLPVYLHKANTYANAQRSRNRALFDFAQQLNDHGVPRELALDAVIGLRGQLTEYAASGEHDPLTLTELEMCVESAYRLPPRGGAANPDSAAVTDTEAAWARQLTPATAEVPGNEAVTPNEGGTGVTSPAVTERDGIPPGGQDTTGPVRVTGERPRNRDTDVANAELLEALLRGRLLKSGELGWFLWNGRRWEPDVDQQRELLLRTDVVPHLEREVQLATDDERKVLVRRIARLESRAGIDNAFKSAAPTLTEKVTDLDARLDLLNTPSGVINLETGDLLPAAPELLMTRMTPTAYDPHADTTEWERIVGEILPSAVDREFLRRWLGSCLTGHVEEKAICCLHGPANAGKSTISEAAQRALGLVSDGGYAAVWQAGVIEQRALSNTNREEAAMRSRGARLVVTAEMDKGSKMAAGFVKSVTGGDTVTGRALYQNSVTFQPQFKLLMHTNYLPRSSDVALQKRLRLLKFTQRFEGDRAKQSVIDRVHHDPALRSQVLAWLVRGCRDWYAAGRLAGFPEEHAEQLERYQEASDVVVQFLRDVTVQVDADLGRAQTWVTWRELWRAFAAWTAATRHHARTERALRDSVAELGYQVLAFPSRGDVVRGVALRAPEAPEAPVSAPSAPAEDGWQL